MKNFIFNYRKNDFKFIQSHKCGELISCITSNNEKLIFKKTKNGKKHTVQIIKNDIVIHNVEGKKSDISGLYDKIKKELLPKSSIRRLTEITIIALALSLMGIAACKAYKYKKFHHYHATYGASFNETHSEIIGDLHDEIIMPNIDPEKTDESIVEPIVEDTPEKIVPAETKIQKEAKADATDKPYSLPDYTPNLKMEALYSKLIDRSDLSQDQIIELQKSAKAKISQGGRISVAESIALDTAVRNLALSQDLIEIQGTDNNFILKNNSLVQFEQEREFNVNEFGIPTYPKANTFLATTKSIRLPFPGGGDVKNPDHLNSFGLDGNLAVAIN